MFNKIQQKCVIIIFNEIFFTGCVTKMESSNCYLLGCGTLANADDADADAVRVRADDDARAAATAAHVCGRAGTCGYTDTIPRDYHYHYHDYYCFQQR